MNLPRRALLLSLLLLGAACIGGQTGTPASDERPDVICDDPPEDPTAYGPRRLDLWNAFEGEYTLTAVDVGSWREPTKEPLPPRTFTFTITRSDEDLHELRCDTVHAPVLVGIHGDGVDETRHGYLRGTPAAAELSLRAAERGEQVETGPQFVELQPGRITFLNMILGDGTHWAFPGLLPEEP